MKLLTLGACFVFFFSARVACSQPKIAVSSTSYDLGTVYAGAVVAWPVRVYNEGDRPLNIEDVNVPCDCAQVSMSARSIPPGHSAEMHVSVNTAGREGQAGRRLLIVSNDLPNRNFFIEFALNIVQPMGLSTETVEFERKPKSETGIAHVVVKNNWNRPFTITGIEDPGNIIASEIDRPSIAPNDSATISMRVRAMPRSGNQTWIEITSDAASVPSRKVQVTF